MRYLFVLLCLVWGFFLGSFYAIQRLFSLSGKILKLAIVPIFWIFSLALFCIMLFIFSPYPSVKFPSPRVLTIEQGAKLNDIAHLLKNENIYPLPRLFIITSRLYGLDRKIRAGKFIIKEKTNLITLLPLLTKGGNFAVNITIPEGYNIYQIASLLQSTLDVDSSRFVSLALDDAFVHSLGIPSTTIGGTTSAEGFLLPNTYNLNPGTTPEEILTLLYSNYKKALPSDFYPRLSQLNLTEKELITMASIIEAEAKKDEERKVIASVYYNRLRCGMLLQADPTILYGLKKFGKKPSRKDMEIDNPYNTYKYPGLPPTPICNPGIKSIEAALHPLETDYLYFVAKGDGYHAFATNIDDHIKNIQRYRR